MTDFTAIKNALRALRIETPSWAYGNSGTRFKVFAQPGVPRAIPYEKISGRRGRAIASPAACRPSRSTSPGTASTSYDELAKFAARPRHRHRLDQPQCVPGRGLPDRQRLQPRPTSSPQGNRPPVGVRRHRGTPPAPEILTCWFPDGTNYAGPGLHSRSPGPPRRGACTRPYAADARPAPDAHRVQAVRARVLHDGRARLGHQPAALSAARRAGAGARRHRSPRPGHEHRDDRRGPAARRDVSAASTSTAATTPTTTSWSAPPTRSSCSGSCSRSSRPTR